MVAEEVPISPLDILASEAQKSTTVTLNDRRTSKAKREECSSDDRALLKRFFPGTATSYVYMFGSNSFCFEGAGARTSNATEDSPFLGEPDEEHENADALSEDYDEAI